MNKFKMKLNKLSSKSYGSDFLQTWDKSLDQIKLTLHVAEELREMFISNIDTRVFTAGLAVSWFRDKSTRTRFSFKSAASILGLDVEDINEELSQISHGETVRETANMISFLTEVIGIRDDIYLGVGHKFQMEVANAVSEGYNEGILPVRTSVINLQSDTDHPTQSLSDLLHLKNYYGSFEKLKGKKLVMSWAYSPSYGKPLSVAQGVIALMTRFGMNVVLCYPKGYNLIPELEAKANEFSRNSGGSCQILNDMNEAFKNADVVYPKSWASYEVMLKRTELLRKNDKEGLKNLENLALTENAKHKNWECNEAKMRLTKNGQALYMHCLPADVSGVSCKTGEVSENIFESFKVQTFNQAGYKPYVIAAMILLTKYSNPRKLLKHLKNRRLHRQTII